MLYGLVLRRERIPSLDQPEPQLAFVIGASAKEVWDSVIESELLGTGHTKASLKKLGWRAEPITIVF